MTPALEIILPIRNPGAELAAMVASLAAQTDRRFGVILSDNFSSSGLEHIATAEQCLASAGISVRRLRPPAALGRIEHWNWAHAQSQAAWLKPLLAGGRLQPTYVERLQGCIHERPGARFIRCDAEIQTEWGPETLRAPFAEAAITPTDFLAYFPARVDWIGNLLGVAYHRVAWLATGGYSVHLPACAALNLNVILALHHGMENLPERLVTARFAERHSLNEITGGRVNLWLELWFVMRQAQNYCLATKLPWPYGGGVRGVWRGQSLRGEAV
ncbi:MAG: hypothetical protein JWR69_4502 [Pedosphaera sp.]|nr:hypothetical protein [Pedosphaera sp.]